MKVTIISLHRCLKLFQNCPDRYFRIGPLPKDMTHNITQSGMFLTHAKASGKSLEIALMGQHSLWMHGRIVKL